MKALTTQTIRCRAHWGAVWRQRCALDAVHVLDGGRAHWAGNGAQWAIAESERMTETERRTYDFLTSEPGPISPEGALIHIATIRDIGWMRTHAARMAMVTSGMLVAFLAFLLIWGH